MERKSSLNSHKSSPSCWIQCFCCHFLTTIMLFPFPCLPFRSLTNLIAICYTITSIFGQNWNSFIHSFGLLDGCPVVSSAEMSIANSTQWKRAIKNAKDVTYCAFACVLHTPRRAYSDDNSEVKLKLKIQIV